MRPETPLRQRGIGLVIVLWCLVLLSAMAVSYAFGVRTEVRGARNQVEQAQASALAEAGVARGLWELAARPPRPGEAARPGGVEQLDTGEAHWRLSSPSGRVDLNAATPELLERLLAEALPEADRRRALVAAIQDWRDPDSLRRQDGAEDRDYLADGAGHGAADRPFRHPAELLQVRGMTPALFASISPHLTVHSGVSGVNPRHAEPSLLRLLGAQPEVLEEFLALREAEPDSPALATLEVLPRGLSSAGDTGVVLVRGRGVTPGGAEARLEVLVQPGRGAGETPRVVGWQPLYGEAGQ